MEDWIQVAYYALGGWVIFFLISALWGRIFEESWGGILLITTGVWFIFAMATLFLIGGDYLWKIG